MQNHSESIFIGIELIDGSVLRFTTMDHSISVEGNVYEPGLQMERLNLSALSEGDTGITVNIFSPKIMDLTKSRADIIYGVSTTSAKTIYRGLILTASRLSELIYELRIVLIFYALQIGIGEFFSASCRAQFGDARCGTNIATYTSNGSVTKYINNYIFIGAHDNKGLKYFDGGRLIFLDGANKGRIYQVQSETQLRISLLLPLYHQPAVGDKYQISAGCDKSASTCRTKFRNIINFRGEPFIAIK